MIPAARGRVLQKRHAGQLAALDKPALGGVEAPELIPFLTLNVILIPFLILAVILIIILILTIILTIFVVPDQLRAWHGPHMAWPSHSMALTWHKPNTTHLTSCTRTRTPTHTPTRTLTRTLTPTRTPNPNPKVSRRGNDAVG